MTPHQLRNQLHNFRDLLRDHGIAHVSNPVVCNSDGSEVRVTWLRRGADVPPLGSSEFATIDEYCTYLRHQLYWLVLNDGGILQVTYDFHRNHLAQHRLCYYPCPFDLDLSEWQEEGILDVIECFRAEGEKHVRLRSPIRFDYNPQDAAPGHSACHVHLLRASCRCPVVAPLSAGHFLKFVFSNFYARTYERHEFLRELPQTLGNKTIRPEEERALHIGCKR